MIEKALNTLGKRRCSNCGKIMDEKKVICPRCGYGEVKASATTSTPEDGL